MNLGISEKGHLWKMVYGGIPFLIPYRTSKWLIHGAPWLMPFGGAGGILVEWFVAFGGEHPSQPGFIHQGSLSVIPNWAIMTNRTLGATVDGQNGLPSLPPLATE